MQTAVEIKNDQHIPKLLSKSDFCEYGDNGRDGCRVRITFVEYSSLRTSRFIDDDMMIYASCNNKIFFFDLF